jgi:hypothetical protein
MISIDWLIQWFDSNKPKLSAQGISYSLFVRNTETDNPAQSVHIDTEEKVAAITLWESGECDYEALEVGIDGLNLFENRLIKSEQDLDDFLRLVISLL